MTMSKALLLLAALGLAACSTPAERFGDRPGDGRDGVLSDDPSGLGDGSVSDPTSVAYFRASVGDRVLFAVDESTLSGEARQILDGQANWLIDNRDFTVAIEGHADEQGTREYNLALGARRASAVQQYLITRGVDPARLRTVTYGKERPIEICSEESCYAKNRRAVTVLVAGPSA